MTTPPDVAIHALVPCAGSGERAGAGQPKQYAPLGGATVVSHALTALARVPRIVQTLVVLAPGDVQFEASASAFAGTVLRAWRCDARGHGARRARGIAAPAAPVPTTGCWSTTRRAAWCNRRRSNG